MSVEPIVLERIPRDRIAILESLFQLYAHDFSEQVALELQPNGRFDVPISEQWWTSEDHHPFFIRSNGRLVGFALVRRGSRVTHDHDVMDVAEFFVIRGERRRKVGSLAARALFEAFPGAWEIRVRQTNVGAKGFWSQCAEAWTGMPASSTAVTLSGVEWMVIRISATARG